MGAPIINAAEFASFVLVFLRISMVVVVAPIFSSDNIVAQAKVAICLLMALVVAPQVSYEPELMPMTWFGFAFLALGEILLGLLLGFMVRLILEAVNMTGTYLGFQMGLSMANVMDPQSGGQQAVIARFVYIVAVLIFLYANGHYLVLKAMVESFQVAPPGMLAVWRPEMFTEIINATTRMFVLSLKLAAPVIAVIFCIMVAFGIVAKAVPQMNILFVGMPVYILVGLTMLLISLPWWPQVLGSVLLETDAALGRILLYLAP